MPAFDQKSFPVLFRNKWPATELAAAISKINHNPDQLCDEYKHLQACAPNREQGYFTGHDGTLSRPVKLNARVQRYEEHLAIALFNEKSEWSAPCGGVLRLLDYQFPLKSRRNDKGIGKIDLLGITDEGRLTVIELKIHPKSEKERGDNPMTALMEGLRYTAIVQANQDNIIIEAKAKFGIEIRDTPPVIWLMGTEAWWRGWSTELASSTRQKLDHWEPEFAHLCRNINQSMDIEINCVALQGIDRDDIDYGPDRNRPRFKGEFQFCSVSLGDGLDIIPVK